MRHLMLVVEYRGTNYHGFQVQPGVPTIQGELEAALERIAGERIRIAGAGRTDAGVHALGQVVSFAISSTLELARLGRAVNAVLPADIAVREVREVPPDFHARYSVRSRWYRYTILNREARAPLEADLVYHFRPFLDVEAMQEAGEFLVGDHDFRAFGTGRTTRRQVERVGCQRQGQKVVIDLVANAFLAGMVRSIAGTLLRVGIGRLMPLEFEQILRRGERALAGPSLPACGLCLIAVYY